MPGISSAGKSYSIYTDSLKFPDSSFRLLFRCGGGPQIRRLSRLIGGKKINN